MTTAKLNFENFVTVKIIAFFLFPILCQIPSKYSIIYLFNFVIFTLWICIWCAHATQCYWTGTGQKISPIWEELFNGWTIVTHHQQRENMRLWMKWVDQKYVCQTIVTGMRVLLTSLFKKVHKHISQNVEPYVNGSDIYSCNYLPVSYTPQTYCIVLVSIYCIGNYSHLSGTSFWELLLWFPLRLE